MERWDKELRNAGFAGAESVVYDDETPYQINVNIVTSPARTSDFARKLTLLCDSNTSSISRQVESLFISKGFTVEFSNLDGIPTENQDVVSLLDLTAPFFDKISAHKLSAFQRYVGNLKSTGMLWATRSAQVGCNDPRYGQILGMARTIRSELLVDFATFEIDVVDSRALDALFELFCKFQGRSKGPQYDPDWEFAFCEGVVQIPRYHWLSVSQSLSATSKKELPRKLEIGKLGALQSLRWIEDKPIILTHDQVEVEPRAVGLNFKVRFWRSIGNLH